MDRVTEYIQGFLRHPHPLLEELEREYQARDDVSPHIGIHVGTFLAWLIRVSGAKRCVEFGTALGYSTIYLAGALRETGGVLTAVESDENYFRETNRNVRRAGLSQIVHLIHGDASEIVEELAGPFDLILQDAAKSIYPAMLEKCVERTRPGGVIAADDALFPPMGVREELSRAIDEYNRLAFKHPQLVSTILPIGDGLTISVKR